MRIGRLNLPEGSEARGDLSFDPASEYGLGDVFEVELPTGFMIDVGWDDSEEGGPFRIVVYREYFGESDAEIHAATIDAMIAAVNDLAEQYGRPLRLASCSTQVSSTALGNRARGLSLLRAC